MTTANKLRERDYRIDKRRYAAQSIARALFAEIQDLIPHEAEREVHVRLLETLYKNGVLLVQDAERSTLGLEGCDLKGWTPSERVKYEQDKLAAMFEASKMIIPENRKEQTND